MASKWNRANKRSHSEQTDYTQIKIKIIFMLGVVARSLWCQHLRGRSRRTMQVQDQFGLHSQLCVWLEKRWGQGTLRDGEEKKNTCDWYRENTYDWHTGTTAEKEKDHHKGETEMEEGIRAEWQTRHTCLHSYIYTHKENIQQSLSHIF